MSDHASSSPCTGCSTCNLQKYHFLLRRLHSLTGIIPIGAFVCFHLFTNMQMILGSFQHEVNFIHNMPALFMMEVFGLWLPIAFHAILGIYYTFSGRINLPSYTYSSNWRYTLQRITGIIAFIFIFLHIATLRWRWDLLGWFTPFFSKGISEQNTVVDLAHYSASLALQHPIILLVYIIGVLSAVYHWSNGLWTAAISWGATITVQAQKRWGHVCAGLFLFLTIATAAALIGAVSYAKHAPQEQKTAYQLMSQNYRDGKLSFETLEKLAVAPTGSTFLLESPHNNTAPHQTPPTH